MQPKATILVETTGFPECPRWHLGALWFTLSNRIMVGPLIDPRFATNETGIGAGLPAGPSHSLDEVFSDTQVQHCNQAEDVGHPVLGTTRQVVTLISTSTFQEQSSSRRTRLPPPDLGEHSVALLREANFDLHTVDSLLEAGIVHQAKTPAQSAAPKCQAEAI